MRERILLGVLCLSLAASMLPTTADAGTRLLRFPDVCADRIVFTYAGDLWTVGTRGGTAIRLTAGPGVEQAAHFSPDRRLGRRLGHPQIRQNPTSPVRNFQQTHSARPLFSGGSTDPSGVFSQNLAQLCRDIRYLQV